MKTKLFGFLAFLCCFSVISVTFSGCEFLFGDGGTNYYFDSSAADGGDGSEKSPFNNLSYISGLELGGGENIRLKAGSKFTGSLELKNISGTETAAVVITSYGDTEKYGLPAIDGDDLTGTGVLYVENCNYVTVENLELYDSATTEGDRRGVLVNLTNPDGGGVITYSGITLKNLYIHDIRGITDAANSGMSEASKKTGGIHVWSADGLGRSDGLTVCGCRIDNVDNVGIATWYKPGTGSSSKVSPYSSEFGTYSHSNLLIGNNEISRIGKNAIFARNLNGGYVQYNTMYETATTCVSGNTICTSYVYGTVVQYNEGYYNRASVRPSDGAVQDGCMLDADLMSRDTVWQYNYSHDNAFGLFLNCTSYNAAEGIADKVTVRYNLSVHDYGNKGIVYINYATAGVEMYNNTFIVSAETSPIILKSNGDRRFSFYNNIIYNCSENAKFEIADTAYADIGNNLIYNAGNAAIDGLEAFGDMNSDGIYSDPVFVGIYDDLAERAGRAFAEIFKLNAASPAYSAGRPLVNPVKDFFGNAYKNAIGFYCG